MGTEIESAFVLLRAAAAATAGNQLITRDIGVQGVQAALDSEGRKHLIFSVDPGTDVPTDVRSRGVHLLPLTFNVDGKDAVLAVLRCVSTSLDLVFDHLADDVVTRISNGASPIDACQTALEDWRAMLRQSSQLSASQIVGLCAELEVLKILGREHPGTALHAWTGPTKTIHDFVRNRCAIEVKGSATLEGSTVSIHGLDQLDLGENDRLYLVVAHCRLSENAPSLDDRIRNLFLLGFPQTELVGRIGDAGYVYESNLSIPTTYDILSLRVWNVTTDFPGLRRSALCQPAQRGISNVQFDLSLAAAPDPLHPDAVEGVFQEWAR